MSNSTTEETQIISESTRSLSRGKFSILTKFLPQIRFLLFRVLGGRSVITRIGFFVFVLIVVVGFVVCRSSCLKADFRVPVGFPLPVPNTGRLSTEPVLLAQGVWRVYQS